MQKWLKLIGVKQAVVLGVAVMTVVIGFYEFKLKTESGKLNQAQIKELALTAGGNDLRRQLNAIMAEYETLKKADQLKINQELSGELKSIKQTYKDTLVAYERLIDLKGDKKQFGLLDKNFALILKQLSEEKYTSASATLKTLTADIDKEQAKIAAVAVAAMPANLPQNNTPPESGLGRQVVKTAGGDYTVAVISANLATTKVIVDTASDKDCGDNCPVMSLSAYAQRSGAFAAINGPYFCPATYPACANKKNTFDTLLMNKNKYYFNSDNNVYSSVPAAIFSTGSRFVGKSMDWGRDTGVDSVIAGQPMLVSNGQSQFGGDGDPKKTGKGSRAFIGATDNTVYIGIVYNASVAEAATVIATMGIKNAINLDSGGSIAMWNNGKYVAGPGRDLPFGIMLVKR
jgi:exopolysaccharide biosynthesis protein